MKRILLPFAVLGLLILLGFYYIKNQNSGTNYSADAPSITDKNLSQFYLWTIEDPLFTSPVFDAKAFSEAITNLEATEALYMRQFHLKYKIYPDSFLKDLVSVNKAHNDFVNNPTVVNANNLIAIYRATATDYESGINNLQQPVKSFTSANPKIDFNNIYAEGIDTATNLKIFSDDLEKIKSNASALAQEISKRELCLKSGVGCLRPVKDFSNFKEEDKQYSLTKKDLLPRDFLYKSFNPPSGGRPQRDIFLGPYIVSTPCFGWSDDYSEKSYLFSLITNSFYSPATITKETYPRYFYKIATDRYFRKLDDVEKKIYGGKREWIMQTETNDYLCPSKEFKIKINSINYLYTNYKDKSAFSTLSKSQDMPGEVKDVISKGEALEKKFYDSEFPSETDADNLVNYYGLFYQKILAWHQKSEYKDQAWLVNLFNHRMDILNEYLGYQRGLVDVDKIIKSMMLSLDGLRGTTILREAQDAPIRPQVYTYMIRSEIGLFYFPFSKSFYRLDKPLDYLVKAKANNVGFGKQYIDYLGALEHYSIDEIKSWYFPQGKVLQ